MSEDTNVTEWSLPGQMDVPRDELKIQMEVYVETILLRGFEDGANWVRTVSADAIANAFTQHLGLSTGILPKETAVVEPVRDRTGSGPLAAAEGVAGGPATGGFQAARTVASSHARPGLRLLAGPGALGLRRQEPAHRSRAAALPGSGLQRLRRRAGLSR